MDAARIELKLVLDQAGIGEPKLDTFSQRFNIQKRIYLIQVNGYDLGYRFGWYLRGPYARDLTADAFTLRDEIADGETDFEEYALSDKGKERIQCADKLWNFPRDAGVDQDQWLELLASLHYLRHIAYWQTGAERDFEAVFIKLIASKPQFQALKSGAERAWRRLDEFGLIEKKTLA